MSARAAKSFYVESGPHFPDPDRFKINWEIGKHFCESMGGGGIFRSRFGVLMGGEWSLVDAKKLRSLGIEVVEEAECIRLVMNEVVSDGEPGKLDVQRDKEMVTDENGTVLMVEGEPIGAYEKTWWVFEKG